MKCLGLLFGGSSLEQQWVTCRSLSLSEVGSSKRYDCVSMWPGISLSDRRSVAWGLGVCKREQTDFSLAFMTQLTKTVASYLCFAVVSRREVL